MKNLRHIFALLFFWTSICCFDNAQMAIVVKHKGSPLWTPTGTILWLKNDSTTGAVGNGNPVATWYDQSGNSHDVTSSGTDRPTYETGILNGLPVVYFTAPNKMQSGSFTLNQPTTAFIVCNYVGIYSNDYWLDGLSLFTLILGQYAATNTLGMYSGSWLSKTGNVLTSYGVFGGIYNGSSSLISFNGSTATGNPGTGNAGGLTVGQAQNGNSPLTGGVGEIVIYNSAVSTNLRTCIEGYLAWKWGLQADLPGGHAYASAAPTTGSNCT
jgi:hypothetical protein